MRGGSFHGRKVRTKADQRTAATMLLTMRATLDGLTPDTLVRSYGLSEPEAVEMIEKERHRRARAA